MLILLILSLTFKFIATNVNEIQFNHTNRCNNHQDCNQLLSKISHCSNVSIGMNNIKDDCTDEYHRQLLFYLKQNPRVTCREHHCFCENQMYDYDYIDRICRYRCKHDVDCRRFIPIETQSKIINCSNGQSNKYHHHHDYLESFNRFVPMICSKQGLCRCPQYSRQSLLDWTIDSCLEDIQVEFHNYNFIAITIISLTFIIIIIMAPIILFCIGQQQQKTNNHYNRQNKLKDSII